jgi:hypothetical protein
MCHEFLQLDTSPEPRIPAPGPRTPIPQPFPRYPPSIIARFAGWRDTTANSTTPWPPPEPGGECFGQLDTLPKARTCSVGPRLFGIHGGRTADLQNRSALLGGVCILRQVARVTSALMRMKRQERQMEGIACSIDPTSQEADGGNSPVPSGPGPFGQVDRLRGGGRKKVGESRNE